MGYGMDDVSLEDIVRQLSDLEVALFLSLAAREHCLIETNSGSIHDLAKELALVNMPENLSNFYIY